MVTKLFGVSFIFTAKSSTHMHVRPLYFKPQANYGRSDEGCVEKVKVVYESVNLRQLYVEYEEQI